MSENYAASPRITVFPATLNRFTATPIAEKRKRRVAAYARVSTNSDEQKTSYEAQVSYYTDYISAKPDWRFVQVYADKGITGTSTKRRERFKDMIADALAGKIDLIITKSVSRFARNTVDSLTTIRLLKEHGVEVYFEEQNIYTLDSKGELLLTIMSSLAQEESRSISENVTWGQRKRFADGKVSMPYKQFLGYRKGENGEPEIVPEEAETVRRIYRLFLDGMTPYKIKLTLESEGTLSPSGRSTWQPRTILSILTNEKYKGDALLQKTFCTDFLTKKMKVNEGEVPQYYVENSHPAIVSDEVYEEVQLELERRRKLGRQHNSQHCFSGRIYCGCCGSVYGSKVWHSNDKYRRTVWQCNARFVKGTGCQTPHLSEPMIEQKFLAAFNQLLTQRDFIADDMQAILQHLTDTAELDAEKEALQVEMGIVSELIRQAVGQNASAALDQAEYNRKYNSLTERFHKAADRVKEIDAECSRRKGQRREIENFRNAVLANDQPVTVFSTEFWNATIDRMTVNLDGSVKVAFRNGIEMTV